MRVALYARISTADKEQNRHDSPQVRSAAVRQHGCWV